jgi:plastocyanin
MRRSLSAAAACVVLAAASVVVATSAQAHPTNQARRSAASPTIVIKDFGFSGDLTVRPGVTVKVVNKDSVTHTLTDKKTHLWDTGRIAPHGGTASFTAPSTVGRYPFGCKIHPEMKGTLIVAIPAQPSSITAPKATAIVKGHSVGLKATLTDTKTDTRIAHATVRLLGRVGSHGAFHRIESVSTNFNGVARTRVSPTKTTQYKWRFAGSSGHHAATSTVGKVTVRAN